MFIFHVALNSLATPSQGDELCRSGHFDREFTACRLQAQGCSHSLCVHAHAVDVLERSYNKFRTGANTSETLLTPANVKSSANR
jgi:hypothetical protein